MKLKQKQINDAYTALVYLSRLKLPIKISYGLYKIAKVLEDKFNFSIEEEKKLLECYNAKLDDQGLIHFEDSNSVMKFNKEHEELLNLEYNLDITPVTIDIETISDQKISMTDLISLEGLVLFE